MDEYITYTDKIIDEMLNQNILEKDRTSFIDTKYLDKGFTLIGIRRERRIVADRINENSTNRFDAICAATLTIMAGIISFLFGNELLSSGAILKLLFPLITVSFMAILFSNTLYGMRDKRKLYAVCDYKLAELQSALEDEYAKVELRKMLDEGYVEGAIFNSAEEEETSEESIEDAEKETIENMESEVLDDVGEDSVEIESFEFDFPELLGDEKVAAGVA